MKLDRTFIVSALTGALLGSTVSGVFASEIFVYKDKNGEFQLTDRPIHDGFRRITDNNWRHKPMVSLDTKNFAKNRTRFQSLVGKAARRYRLDEALLDAVITAESAYDPRAVSKAGAVGLMQLMPATARRYGVNDRYDAEANLYAGSRYLRDLLDMFKNTRLAVAAYNAGENSVIRYGHKIPPYEETQKYVKKVMYYYEKYRASL